jgi:hypothetical protein
MIRYVFNPFTGAFDEVDSPHLFVATCTLGESVGSLVYATGVDRQVRSIDIDDTDKFPPAGIIAEIDGTDCVVQTTGEVALSGIVAGASYYAGTNSRPSITRPPRPTSGKRFIQHVGFGLDSATLLLHFEKPTRIVPL